MPSSAHSTFSAHDIFKQLEKNARAYTFPPAEIKHPKETSKHAIKSISAFLTQNHKNLVEESAAFLESLFEVWLAHHIPPQEIWAELKRREQLGSVFLNLNSRPTLHPKRDLPRKWKTKSTKLP